MNRVLLAIVLLAACTSAEDADTSDPVASTCDTVQERATAAVLAEQACTTDVGCELVDMSDLGGDNSCLAAFHCLKAFPTGADLSALSATATSLTAERVDQGCADCRDDVACDDPTALRAECNVSTGLCEVVR